MKLMNVNWLWVLAILFTICFTIIGCEQFYRGLSFTDQEAAMLAERDRQFLFQSLTKGIIGIVADKEIQRLELLEAVQESQAVFWRWVSLGISALGSLGSGILAKYWHRENKTVKAVVVGVENGTGKNVKDSIKAAATAAGVEGHLSKVVKKVISQG